jgi:hypothetical protein
MIPPYNAETRPQMALDANQIPHVEFVGCGNSLFIINEL